MSWVYGWIWNLVVYFILVTAVTSVLPGEQYRKYIRLFTGVMMILVMADPLLQLLRLDESLLSSFEEYSVRQEKEELREEMEAMEGVAESYVMEHYRRQLEFSIRQTGAQYGAVLEVEELLLEEDLESPDYGRILYLSVGASLEEEGQDGWEEELEERLSEEFGVAKSNLRVRAQEGAGYGQRQSGR